MQIGNERSGCFLMLRHERASPAAVCKGRGGHRVSKAMSLKNMPQPLVRVDSLSSVAWEDLIGDSVGGDFYSAGIYLTASLIVLHLPELLCHYYAFSKY